jgi:hypothetical protein
VIYAELQDMLRQELEKSGVLASETMDPLKQASNALRDLQDTIYKLLDCIMVQKVEEATEFRARQIARIAGDANKVLNYGMSSLGPLPQVAKERAVEIAKIHFVADAMQFSDGMPPADLDKKSKEEWNRKCWFIQVSPVSGTCGETEPRLLGIAKKDGAILYDSSNINPE